MIKNAEFNEIHTFLLLRGYRGDEFQNTKIFAKEEKKIDFKFKLFSVCQISFFIFTKGMWEKYDDIINPTSDGFYKYFDSHFDEPTLKRFESYYDNED